VSNAFASELLKLRTTRTFWALTLSAALATVGLTALVASLATWGPGDTAPGEDLIGLAFLGRALALVLGLLAVTTELRHGTITSTLLAVPSRSRLIGAKVAAHLLAGFVLALVAALVCLALSEAILAAREIDSGTSPGEAMRWCLGLGLAGALAAGLGVGVGAIIRNQVGALIGGIVWPLLVEPLLAAIPTIGDGVARFGIGGLMDGLDGFASPGDTDVLGQLPAALVFAAYMALAAALGAALLRRRDVTA
jgi:ABC-2 type transport system permease protein